MKPLKSAAPYILIALCFAAFIYFSQSIRGYSVPPQTTPSKAPQSAE